MNNKFSCYIIGSESHLIRCAEILLENGHQINGIISAEKLIIDWARKHDIQNIGPGPGLADFISRDQFDYFFSIINNYVIPDEILALPRKGAINFHDGPLPRYAGLYVTSWVIINQEKVHGVTWHSMSAGIDKGDILKQRYIDIIESDTAFTINAKCYEASITAFAELVGELASGRVQFYKQELSKRTYFSKCKRPPAACTISWQEPANKISALVRALDFGPNTTYTNPLGLPKLVIRDEVFIVPEIEILSSNSRAEPGTIISIDDDSIIVATATYDVILSKLLSINGRLLSFDDIVSKYGVCKEYKLDEFDKETTDQLTAFNSEICRHEEFWLNRLVKLESVELPYANHNKAQTNLTQYATLSMPIVNEINNLLTVYNDIENRSNVVLAAFAAYLARITSSFDFSLWFNHFALKQAFVGFEQFYSTHVPLCVKVEATDGFNAFLQTLQAELEQVKKHKTYACDLYLRYPELDRLRSHGNHSLWPIVVEVVESFDDYSPFSGSELSILISEDGTECRWVYDTEILDKEYIDSMQYQFTVFLRNVVANDKHPVVETPLLNIESYNQIVSEWNNTKIDFPQDLLIHQLFEAQAEKSPDTIAVIFEDKQLNYRELNQRANHLAHYLQSIGIGPEALVGIAVERSIEMVVGLYGILKAGGAYVPVDPAYPSERIAYMLENAKVPVLLTQSKLLDKLPAHNAQVIYLDTEWEKLMAEQSVDNPVCNATLANLAYTIYTSGSTGKPKGVMNTHKGILNRLLWMQEAYRLDASDRVLQKTPFSFDVSVWEFFWPLMFGASLVVARPEGHKDNDYLVETIIEQQITTMHFVPSMLSLFLEAKDIEKCTSLRQVICSGEALSLDLQNRFFERLGAKLHNLYGPTEAAVDVTYRECRQESDLKIVPIGRPVSNTQIYILDKYMQPVPIGVPGELHIGGVQVARGYLNQPDLTAEKFIPDPFSDNPEERLYKTGDLARYMPDGNIEYLGRIDHQVKVRGFRVELGEIESVLCQYASVHEAVVMAREDVPGDKRLVAYVVPKQNTSIDVIELRNFLKDKLPEYMVPAAFILLDSLPLMPNGKVNRKELPVPEREHQTAEAYVAPKNKLEKMIAGLWQKLLQVEKVGLYDNFFDLGGHSLLIVRAHNLLQDKIDKEITVTDMFRFPTISALTGYLSHDRDNDGKAGLQKSIDRAGMRRAAIMRVRERGKYQDNSL